MNKIFTSCLLVAAIAVSAFKVAGPSENTTPPASEASALFAIKNYKVDPEKSNIVWVGRKVTGEHTGLISLHSGTILLDRATLRGGTILMDMNSITCTDLKDPKSNGNLVKHLKSDDFFSVEKNPRAMFAITNLTPRENAKAGTANYIVTGDLTIKGKSNQISFPILVTLKKGVATAKGTLKFDRTKWDIQYRSGNFFENLGDKAIHDDVELQIELVANEEKEEKKSKDKKSAKA